jgi:CrcB protein
MLAAAMGTLFAVGLGGAIGSMARYAVGSFLGTQRGWDYWLATMAVNITGAFALGILVGLFGEHVSDDPALRTGELVGAGRVGAGIANVLKAVAAGLAAAIGGLAIGRAPAV